MKINNVLIIDDDNYTIELYRMIIETTSFKKSIRTELSAQNAIKYLHDVREKSPVKFPDFILLDLRMPEMHGFEFLVLFENEFSDMKGKTKFIITTSSLNQEERHKAFEFDLVVDYLIKPLPADYIKTLTTRK